MTTLWGIRPEKFLLQWAAASLIWTAALTAEFPPEPRTWALLAGGVVCLGAAVVDLHTRILPDVFTLGGGSVVVGLCAWTGGWEPALAGAALGFAGLKGLQWFLRRHRAGEEQIGSGDAKLMLALGAMTGPWGLLPAWGVACLLTLLWTLLRRTGIVAFGPGLTLGALLTVLLGLCWPLP